MLKTQRNRRLSAVAGAFAGAFALLAVAVPTQPAKASPFYLGWDFGNGVGVGIGTPPSAYGYHYCGLVATSDPYCHTW